MDRETFSHSNGRKRTFQKTVDLWSDHEEVIHSATDLDLPSGTSSTIDGAKNHMRTVVDIPSVSTAATRRTERNRGLKDRGPLDSSRCEQLLGRCGDTASELEKHLIRDDVGDIYPADTPEARAALEADMLALREFERECL